MGVIAVASFSALAISGIVLERKLIENEKFTSASIVRKLVSYGIPLSALAFAIYMLSKVSMMFL